MSYQSLVTTIATNLEYGDIKRCAIHYFRLNTEMQHKTMELLLRATTLNS